MLDRLAEQNPPPVDFKTLLAQRPFEIEIGYRTVQLTLGARTGEEGKLFGSVTNLDIERALREKGVDVERRKIYLPEPIKQLGEVTVAVKLDPEVEASIKLSVVAE